MKFPKKIGLSFLDAIYAALNAVAFEDYLARACLIVGTRSETHRFLQDCIVSLPRQYSKDLNDDMIRRKLPAFTSSKIRGLASLFRLTDVELDEKLKDPNLYSFFEQLKSVKLSEEHDKAFGDMISTVNLTPSPNQKKIRANNELPLLLDKARFGFYPFFPNCIIAVFGFTSHFLN